MRPLVSLLLAASVLAGCLAGEPVETAADVPTDGITPVRQRADMAFRTDGAWSRTLEEGPYGILPGEPFLVDVTVPLGEGLPTQQVHMGVFLPEIPGCDWQAAALDDACRVPVVADVGPYYGELIADPPATEPANRLGKFLIENLVPHGYAVAQVSVLGTGESGGCMDLMGEVEQAGVQAAVDWLGTQPWSNGAVGLIGRSYDGSTPWEAAMTGSEHLKTVVPISGLYGQHDLMWRNGSSELRGGSGLLWGIYYAFAYTSNHEDPALQARQIAENAVCPDTQTGLAHAVAAYAADGSLDPYWAERSFKDEILANYEGSVYFVHGMQDWNVDPHMAFPFYGELQAKGLEMKGLFGQWAHNYPDRLKEHEECDGRPDWCKAPTSVRHDWAQDLLEWFDHYLKGTGPKPELHVEMQDNLGRWRIEETWPPSDLVWRDAVLGEGLKKAGSGPDLVVANPAALAGEDATAIVYASDPLDADLRIAGLPQLDLRVTPAGPGGQVYAELRDATDDAHLGHAVLDLRFTTGGMKPVVPGQPIDVRLEFFPMDVVVPAGHALELRLAHTGMDYLPSVVSNPVKVEGGTLRLPTIERGEDAFFAPPGT